MYQNIPDPVFRGVIIEGQMLDVAGGVGLEDVVVCLEEHEQVQKVQLVPLSHLLAVLCEGEC